MLQTASAEFCDWLLLALTSLQGGIPGLNIAQDCPSRCRMPGAWLIDCIMTKSHYQYTNYQFYGQINTRECVLTHVHLFITSYYQSTGKYMTIGMCQEFCSQGGVSQTPPSWAHPPGQTPPLDRHPPGQTPSWADTPLGRHPPWADTLLSRHPPGTKYTPSD